MTSKTLWKDSSNPKPCRAENWSPAIANGNRLAPSSNRVTVRNSRSKVGYLDGKRVDYWVRQWTDDARVEFLKADRIHLVLRQHDASVEVFS